MMCLLVRRTHSSRSLARGCSLQTQLKSCVCVGSVGNCLHTLLLAASGANWNASSTCSAIGARSSIADWNANEPRQTTEGGGGSVLRLDAAAAKEVFSNCSQVFEALQFASFQMEYDPSQRNTPHTPSHLSKPQHTKKTPKQLAKNRLGKYIFVFCVFDVTYVFFSFFLLSVLCAWAT